MEIEKTNIKISSENLRVCTPKNYKPVTITEKEHKIKMLEMAAVILAGRVDYTIDDSLNVASDLLWRWVSTEGINVVIDEITGELK